MIALKVETLNLYVYAWSVPWWKTTQKIARATIRAVWVPNKNPPSPTDWFVIRDKSSGPAAYVTKKTAKRPLPWFRAPK